MVRSYKNKINTLHDLGTYTKIFNELNLIGFANGLEEIDFEDDIDTALICFLPIIIILTLFASISSKMSLSFVLDQGQRDQRRELTVANIAFEVIRNNDTRVYEFKLHDKNNLNGNLNNIMNEYVMGLGTQSITSLHPITRGMETLPSGIRAYTITLTANNTSSICRYYRSTGLLKIRCNPSTDTRIDQQVLTENQPINTWYGPARSIVPKLYGEIRESSLMA